MRRLYGRSRRAKPAITRTPTLRRKNFTILSAVTRESIYVYDVLNGTCNSELYNDFLRRLCQYARREGLVSFFFIADNVAFHHNAGAREIANEFGAQLRFPPRYSPALNPIEHACWKGRVRAKNPTSPLELDRAIHEAAIEIKEESISNIYERMKTKVMIVLAGEELPLN